jgi:hypothetical protein
MLISRDYFFIFLVAIAAAFVETALTIVAYGYFPFVRTVINGLI